MQRNALIFQGNGIWKTMRPAKYPGRFRTSPTALIGIKMNITERLSL
jgi:hypothetical protein